MKNLTALDWIALILVLVGAINWGLVGTVNLNLVESLFGINTMPAHLVYSVVGISALYLILNIFNFKRK